MTAVAIYGYAPRNHNLTGFYNSTACEVQIDTCYAGDLWPMAVPPHAMPASFDAKCDYCGVEQNFTDIGLCACCGAPL